MYSFKRTSWFRSGCSNLESRTREFRSLCLNGSFDTHCKKRSTYESRGEVKELSIISMIQYVALDRSDPQVELVPSCHHDLSRD